MGYAGSVSSPTRRTPNWAQISPSSKGHPWVGARLCLEELGFLDVGFTFAEREAEIGRGEGRPVLPRWAEGWGPSRGRVPLTFSKTGLSTFLSFLPWAGLCSGPGMN